VKHLLILISIFLLSSPVIGDNHKGETLYGLGECLLLPCDYQWIGFGDKDTQPKYQGQVKDGKPNGLGVIFDSNGSKYVGSWENGKWNGQGTYTWKDGSQFVGEWKDGKPWNGTQYNKDGNILGKYVNGSYRPINLL
jgi:hypothetical protein